VTKLAISFHVGKRDQASTDTFITDLRSRLVVVPHLTTDGFQPYIAAVGASFMGSADYGMVQKNYSRGATRGPDHRYEPPRDPFITRTPIQGSPNVETMNTVHVERLNALTLGDIETTAKLVFEAVSPQAYTEFSNWDAETKRLVRLEFGQNEIIDTGTNEVQTLDVTGTVSGGTFTISHMGNTTPTLAYNISNANLTSALEALPSIGAGNVTVGGGPLPTDTTVTFSGNLAGRRIGTAVTGYSPASPLTVTTALTGGGSLAVVQTTPGTGSRRAVAVDLPGIWTAFDLTGDDEGTRTYELELTGVYDTTNSFLARILCINNRTAAW
jgi:hypothetical protein